jgi:molybdopterin synthase catalytic subunit
VREVTESIVAKFPDVIGVAAVHRVGDLAVGSLAVVVGVAEAFHACHALIDDLKSPCRFGAPAVHRRHHEWVGTA